jgi:hypothetical protein
LGPEKCRVKEYGNPNRYWCLKNAERKNTVTQIDISARKVQSERIR